MTYLTGRCTIVDLQSNDPIQIRQRYRPATALPQEPFELPKPELATKQHKTLLEFENEQPPKRETLGWPRYYVVRSPEPTYLVDIGSDEALTMPRFKPETSLPQTLPIPQPDIRGTIYTEQWDEVFTHRYG
jgi:hypothetical protein